MEFVCIIIFIFLIVISMRDIIYDRSHKIFSFLTILFSSLTIISIVMLMDQKEEINKNLSTIINNHKTVDNRKIVNTSIPIEYKDIKLNVHLAFYEKPSNDHLNLITVLTISYFKSFMEEEVRTLEKFQKGFNNMYREHCAYYLEIDSMNSKKLFN